MDRTWRRESSGCTGRCSKAAIGRSRRGAATNLKADGSKRALGIAALEDKIVQHALATVLGAIFAVPGNLQRLAGFRRAVCRAWLQALRSRSQLARLPWSRFARLVALFIPLVRQLHPYHNAFASLLKQEPYAVMPQVRIRAGGLGQPRFLPRPASASCIRLDLN